MKDTKHIIYLAGALGMLLYAVPQLQTGQGWTQATIFSAGWIVFALLVIAAQLHQIFGINEQEKRELQRIKSVRRWRMEQAVIGNKNKGLPYNMPGKHESVRNQ